MAVAPAFPCGTLGPSSPTPAREDWPTEAAAAAVWTVDTAVGPKRVPVVTYPVSGASWDAVKGAFTCLRHPAAMQTRHGYIASFNAEGCVQGSLEVWFVYMVDMPAWVDADKASASDRAEWAAWQENARVHELGHVRVAAQAEQVMNDTLEAMACGEAEAAHAALADELRAAQASYDRCTSGGVYQTGCVEGPVFR